MESISGLIAVLLQHSQRLTDLWNFQIIVILGIIGFLLAHADQVTKRLKMFLTVVFIIFALVSLVSLKTFQEREEQLWLIVKEKVSDHTAYRDSERHYVATLKPTGVHWKGIAIILADLLVIFAIISTPSKDE